MPSEGGTLFALPARSVRYAVCEAMGSAVPEGFRPQTPARPTSAAGADVAEGVAVDGVAADPAVFDTDAAPSYRYGVEHASNPKSEGDRDQLSCESVLHGHYSRSVRDVRASDAGSEAAEALRTCRLSRWQETRG